MIEHVSRASEHGMQIQSKTSNCEIYALGKHALTRTELDKSDEYGNKGESREDGRGLQLCIELG